MKEQIFTAAAIGGVLVLALSGQTMSGRDANIPTATDQKFLQEAVKTGNLEVTEAHDQLNSSDPNVRTFAQIMIRDHSLANEKLVGLADKDNAKPPVAMSPTVAPMDPKVYMQREVADHRQAIELFQGEIQNGTAQDVRTLAQNMLPILQSHLQMAQHYVSTGKVTPVPTAAPR